MKDFKQTPKMNAQGSHYCGGGTVKKMADGGSLSDTDLVQAFKAGKVKPVEMPTRNIPNTMNIGGKDVEVKPVEMPRRDYGGTNIPGYGKVKPAPMKTTPYGAALLKKGGKVKRGKISK
jgi:hypothetical protein